MRLGRPALSWARSPRRSLPYRGRWHAGATLSREWRSSAPMRRGRSMPSWGQPARPVATPRPSLRQPPSSAMRSTRLPDRSNRSPPARPRAGRTPIRWPNGPVKPRPARPSSSAPFESWAISHRIFSGSRATLPSRPERVFVALGSNLGDRAAHLRAGREGLAALPGTRVIAASAVEETAPLAGMEQPPYLNQMVLLETDMQPRALLQACQAIERREGRERKEHWGARTLDLDIVRFGDR